jgi:hypothetical protein
LKATRINIMDKVNPALDLEMGERDI